MITLFVSIYRGPSLQFTPQLRMRALSSDKICSVLSLLHSGHSICHIALLTGSSIGTIHSIRSQHCPDLPKSPGGCPSKLSSTNVNYAQHLNQVSLSIKSYLAI